MTENKVHLPIPHQAQIDQWRSEASMYELPDERDAHAEGAEDGAQLVRAKDLAVWAETVFRDGVTSYPIKVCNSVEEAKQ